MIRAACALVVVLALAGCGTAAGAPPSARLRIGVLATSCTADRAAAQARAGLPLAVFDIAWDRYEPQPGVFDAAYAADVRRRVETCANAGVAIVLGPGLQYPPGWVLDLPAGTYRNEVGEAADPPVANLVFSRAVRDAAAGYLRRLGAWEALNFDGGGSTTMAIDGAVVNAPSDPTGEREIGSALALVRKR